jgi:hypothetical protein
MQNPFRSCHLMRSQLCTGHPVEDKLGLVRIAREDLKVSMNRTDAT